MIALRPIQAEDRDRLREWRNREEISRYMYTDHTISVAEHAAWFDRVLVDESTSYWIIAVDGEPTGLLYFYDLSPRDRRCFWGFYLAEEAARGRGVGSFVEYFALRHVFDELGMNKLCCEVLVGNEPVKEMHERFGFTLEGRFREHVVKAGQPTDIYCLAMLAAEWERARPAIEERLRAKGLLQ